MKTALLERGYSAGMPLPEKKPVMFVNKLRRSFELWLEALPSAKVDREFDYDDIFQKTLVAYVGSQRPNPDEIASLVSLYAEHRNISYAGLFISACYHRCKDRKIVFNGLGDVIADYLGYSLPKNKLLIIPEHIEVKAIGQNAEGALVVLGTAREVGWSSTGPIIVKGKALDVGFNSSGPVVVCGEADDAGRECTKFVVVTGSVKNYAGAGAECPVVVYGKASCVATASIGYAYLAGEAQNVGSPNSFGPILVAGKAQKYEGEFVLGPEDCAKVKGLREYMDALIKPFMPAVPWQKQLKAAKRLHAKTLDSHVDYLLRKAGFERKK